MKANIAFLHGPEDLRIEEVELPPLKPNEILIKLKACGICGSDVECFEGKSDEGRYDIAPYTPGHEWAGQAVEVGSAVTSVKPGNKVVGDCVLPCFNCANCKDGKMPSACLNMREVGFRPDSPGGMGEYMILEECYTHVIPDDWHYELGAWVETFNVGYWGVWGNGCDPDASDNCVIIGAGPIGLCASMVCKTAGAQVVVTDPMPARRETIQKYGADFTIDPRDIGDDPAIPNYVKKIYECFGGKIYREGKLIKREGGPTVVIECSGNDAGIASVFDIAGHSARVGFVGHSIGRKVPVEIGKTIWSTLKMKGSGGTSLWFPRTIRFLSRIKDRYDFAALNTHHFNFRDIHKAFDMAVHDKANARKVMLTFDE